MSHPTIAEQEARIETNMREERRLIGRAPATPELPIWRRVVPKTEPQDPNAPPAPIVSYQPPPMVGPGVAIIAKAPPPQWAVKPPRAVPGAAALAALREQGVDEATLARWGVPGK